MRREIVTSNAQDIEEIFRLYRLASAHQRSKKTVVVWPEFERSLVEKEVEEGRQWKYTIEGQIACVWATTYSDEQIWGAHNKDKAVYIHRIATNPEFRGQSFVKKITQWAIGHAKEHGLAYIRLDTIGKNDRLIALYKDAGFDFLGMFELKDTKGLPAHYGEAPACLFQIQLAP